MFENVIISETAKAALETAAADRRVPHTVILEGTDESNRLEAAYALAAAEVCGGETPPCGECSHCRKAMHKAHPDIVVLSKPEKKAMYPVDTIRNLKTDAYVIPGEADCKVYIISEAQYLSTQCQNTLLKLLEEPPQKALFILTCPSVSYLLETVRSRAPSFFLGEIPPVTDEEDGLQTAFALMRLLCEGNETDFMANTAPFEKDKQFLIRVLSGMTAILRDVITQKNGCKTVLTDKDYILSISHKLSSVRAMEMLEKVRQLSEEMQYNLNQNLAVTRLCSVLFSRG